MGAVDDLKNKFIQGDDISTYPVSETVRREQNHVGTFPPETLREILKKHSDACRVFKMITGAGYEDPSKNATDMSQAEHAGRVEIEPEAILDALSSESCSCRVRLDTSNPQLVTVSGQAGTRQIEIDDGIIRFTPPMDNSRGGATSRE